MATKGRIDMLVRFSCFLLLMGSCYSQRDKLQQGEELKDGDELLSAFGKFKLGFFNPFMTTSSSSKRYIGVWYYKPEDRTSYESSFYEVVWVANRNSPIFGKSGSLRIDSTDGNLKIFHSGGNPIAITSFEGARNTSVTLEDSGNLVLHELNSNGSIKGMLWQSFDYLTDTLLPGMKLGINLQTGHQWFLRSWLTLESPAEGSYTFGMDPNLTDRLIIRWFGEVQWTSGLWSNEEFKSWVDRSYNFSYTSNEQEKYFSYSVKDDVIPFPRLQIDQYGDLHADSGFYITDSTICNRGSSYFDVKSGLMSSVDGTKFRESDNMTLHDCRLKCYKNCSCVAFAATNTENKTGCEIWSRGTKFIKSHTDDSRTIYLEFWVTAEIKWRIIAIVGALVVILLCSLSYVARRKYKRKEEKWWLSLTVAVGIVILVPLLSYLCYKAWRKLKAEVQRKMNRRKLLRELGGQTKEKDQATNHDLKIFNFQTIVAATDNFSTANKLGEGGFGPVYKGKLLDDREIAIKRLSRRSGQGIIEFKNEAKLIAKLQHTNLVKLVGCSLQGEERILVYEYMHNKSLDFFIFDSDRKKLLDWKKQVNTNRVVGTYGYMSPEYAMSGIVSTKTDVFSFGVLVLEIVSGKKNNSCYHTEYPLNLVGYAWQLWNEEGFNTVIRPVIAVDATHLKSKTKGVLLVAVCKDGNEMIYPLAFGFANSECSKSWTWFLKQLHDVILHPELVLIVSDRHTGISNGMRAIFPNSAHVLCAYHLPTI
ncbi:hypothetical protein LWI29_013090 [Acer saccharum]|uniref:Receptor-like serine/threonine-protein kinase n=1 Tax=Acer saccharum TaxID=4024 RepID=A0AA39SSF7_ACESA|nr:hypothetical protein LWI29_013090 [Acer saccharum]